MAAIVNYTDLVPVSEAKSYLRLDSTLDLNLEITLLINAACEAIEAYTNHYLKPQNKSYFGQGCYRVYDWPINSVVTPASADNYKESKQQYYSNFALNEVGELTLNVGYNDTDNVPPGLKLAVLEMVRVYFYNSEMPSNTGLVITQEIKKEIARFRRFTI